MCVYIYIYIYNIIYIYIYIYTLDRGTVIIQTIGVSRVLFLAAFLSLQGRLEGRTPGPPTKSFPTKGPRVELSGRLPIQLYGYDSSHPLELRVCLSQTL